jgi:CRISPR-associated endonuclease/helicase Cas3
MAGDSTRPHDATRWIETSQGLLSYAQLAPLLAERVLRLQQKLEKGAYAGATLDESLVRQLHADFCGDLVPDWAGRWRAIAVRVGEYEPPRPHLVAEQMRNYTADLQARLAEPLDLALLPEHLAFAEGRLLSIHPFQDFNGRLARLWLWEILRRLELPPVDLVPLRGTEDEGKYLAALRACDAGRLQPLAVIWQERLSGAGSPDA